MNEIRWPFRGKAMPLCPQLFFQPRFGIVLTGEYKDHIVRFVDQWHAVGKGSFSYRPANVDAQLFVTPRSDFVERLVTDGSQHSSELRLSLCPGQGSY